MIILDFPRYLMETLKRRRSLHGCIAVFMFLTSVSKGSACTAPSSPQCFRRNSSMSIYICEWSMNSAAGDATFALYFNTKKYGNIKKNFSLFNEEELIKHRPVNIWVEAHVGNSTCVSNKTSVTLVDTVKYEAPQNISMSWLKNNLTLRWNAPEKHPALAEIRIRQHEHPAGSWDSRTANTTSETSNYQATVANLLKDTAYQVQIRQRSNHARNPLWSDWCQAEIVPAELEQKPVVSVTVNPAHNSRLVSLTIKPMPRAANITGVTYMLQDTQSFPGCPCQKKTHINVTKRSSFHILYSAVSLNITAKNAAGYSPPAIIHVPAKPAQNLKVCNKTSLNEQLEKKSCLEWYEYPGEDLTPGNVNRIINNKGGNLKKGLSKMDQMRENMTDYVRYLYFEHRCDNRKPVTVKMCVLYKKEGVPLTEPQDFTASGETNSSVHLSWKAIPTLHLRGFLTHYSLCSKKISSQDDSKASEKPQTKNATECYKISAAQMEYHLEKLTPGAKYNISLAGVTQAGEGPRATITIATLFEKPVKMWWGFAFMFVFIMISTICTFILKRIKNKIFPPVPTPVIQDFTSYQPQSQETQEREEEVHELTLLQLHPETMSVNVDPEETTVIREEWDEEEGEEDERDVLSTSRGTGDESPDSTDRTLTEGEMADLEQVDNEIAMLIYRNGLVFDLN